MSGRMIAGRRTSPAPVATHRRQSVNFNVRLRGDRWLQVSEQRTPGQGTAMLQTEITELIKAQRGYEMNAKVITAADEMLSATVQVK